MLEAAREKFKVEWRHGISIFTGVSAENNGSPFNEGSKSTVNFCRQHFQWTLLLLTLLGNKSGVISDSADDDDAIEIWR